MLQKLWWWNIGKQRNAHQSQPQRSNLPKSIVGFCWSSHEHPSVRPGSVLGHLVKSIRLLVVSIKKLQLLLLMPSSAYGNRYYKTTNYICHWMWAFLVQLKDTTWFELFLCSMQSTRVPWTLFIQVCIQTLHSPPLECVLLCQWPTHVKSIRWVTWHRRQSTYWPTDPVPETSVGQVSTKFTWKLTLNRGGADEIESFCISTAPSSATSALEEMTWDKSSFVGCCSSCCTKWLAFTSGR